MADFFITIFIILLLCVGIWGLFVFFKDKDKKAKRNGCITAIAAFVIIPFIFVGIATCNSSEKDSGTSDYSSDTLTINSDTTPSEKETSFVLSDNGATMTIDSVFHFHLTKKNTLTMTTKERPTTVTIYINLTEPVGLYESESDKPSLESNGYYYYGYTIREGDYPAFALMETGEKNSKGEYVYEALPTHPLRMTFTKKQIDYLNHAIDGDYKTQMKPIDYKDLLSYIDFIRITVRGSESGGDFLTPKGDDAYKFFANGVFHERVYGLK